MNCLDGICGMSGVKNETGGKQWYRLITAIFLHLGKFFWVSKVFLLSVNLLLSEGGHSYLTRQAVFGVLNRFHKQGFSLHMKYGMGSG